MAKITAVKSFIVQATLSNFGVDSIIIFCKIARFIVEKKFCCFKIVQLI
jgi:hypothetical protein